MSYIFELPFLYKQTSTIFRNMYDSGYKMVQKCNEVEFDNS